jgi:hypothetical protein
MRTFQLLFLLVALFAGKLTAQAQQVSYQLPDDQQLETPEQCRAHKADFEKAALFLLSSPQDAPDRKAANGYAVSWLAATPDVSISVHTDVIEPLMNNGDLMILHMIGYARYTMEKGDTAHLACNLAGYRAVLNYYSDASHKAPKVAALDRFVKLDKEGKLEEEIAMLLKKAGD